MEKFIHYVWKHKMFPLAPLHTTKGELVEVIDCGLHNSDAGPDFFNAKMKIGGTLWVGNVEMHDKSSDWYVHGHDKNEAYNNVVLHVVGQANAEVFTQNGRQLPQMVLDVPQKVKDRYLQLIVTDNYPPCYAIIPQLSNLMLHSWMSRLQTERLERKTHDILQRVKRCDGSW